MGHIKWIDEVVKDGAFPLLKTYTETAIKHNLKSFGFMGETLPTTYAKHICEYVNEEYTGHIKALNIDISLEQLKQLR